MFQFVEFKVVLEQKTNTLKNPNHNTLNKDDDIEGSQIPVMQFQL